MYKHKVSPIISGTVILTVASLITRIIGFFYRMFLSSEFGEEGMGIYQLTSPILGLSFSLCVSGFQTAISKYVASEESKGHNATALTVLTKGLFFSLTLAIPCTFFIYYFSDYIAEYFLMEIRTAPLIRIISLSIPLSCIHSCINAYYLGRKYAKIPAVTQLIEQLVRVLTVYITCNIIVSCNQSPSLSVAAIGLLAGETASTVVSLLLFSHSAQAVHLNAIKKPENTSDKNNITYKILHMAFVIMINRIIVNLFASAETILLPQSLEKYGLTNQESLSLYGVICGMVLPLLLFPNALTGSVSVMLLPVVSEANEKKQTKKIRKITQRAFLFCFLLGVFFMLFFFLSGKFLGQFMFHSQIAGEYIVKLSFICPLLYLSSTLNSILNGKGKTIQCLLTQIAGLTIRILFLLFFIPVYGINAYIIGLIVSQFVSTVMCMFFIKKYIE